MMWKFLNRDVNNFLLYGICFMGFGWSLPAAVGFSEYFSGIIYGFGSALMIFAPKLNSK